METIFLYIGMCVLVTLFQSTLCKVGGVSDWSNSFNSQYHIQTDEGEERFFKYQTQSGQYRKERRLQDGTVVGTFGWVDPNGYLRLRDYIADSKGFRIVKTKLIYVGRKSQEESSTWNPAPSKSPILANTLLPPPETAFPKSSAKPLEPIYYRNPQLQYLSPYTRTPVTPYEQSTYPTPVASTPVPIVDGFRQPYRYDDLGWQDRKIYSEREREENSLERGFNDGYQEYDGISTVQNGFRYYLPRHYHEETSSDDGQLRSGSFGYIDPFGIRRVIYYNTSPGQGFVHKKNNRYVGFSATPYDPRPNY